MGHRHYGLGHGECHVARAHTHRAARCKHGGTRIGARAGHDEHASTLVLVCVGSWPRKQACELARRPDLRRLDPVEEHIRYADLSHHDLARAGSSRVEHEPSLGRGERHRGVRLDSLGRALARVAVHSRRHVDGDDECTAVVDRRAPQRDVITKWQRGPRAEQSVDHDIGRERTRVRRAGGHAPRNTRRDRCSGSSSGHAREVRRVARRQHAHAAPARKQLARCDPAVPTVVARAARDDDLTRGHVGLYLLGDGAPGCVHQAFQRDREGLDRTLLDLAGLLRTQRPVHAPPSLRLCGC